MLDLIREHLGRRTTTDALGAAALVAAGAAKSLLAQSDPAAQRLGLILDELWFPGGFGADAEPEVLHRIYSDQPAPIDDAGRAAEITARAASWRFLVIGSSRVDPAKGAAAAQRMVGDLDQYLVAATDPRFTAHLLLTGADVLRLGGELDAAGEYLQRAAAGFAELGDQVGLGRCHLLVADSLLTPWSSPELLGFDPWDLSREPVSLDDAAARAALESCEAAAAAFGGAGAPRGLAAVELRRAYLAWRRAEYASARTHARESHTHAATAADAGYVQLANLLDLLSGIALGDAGDLRIRFPREVIGWARGPGSSSFARAFAVLCRSAGRQWLSGGSPEEARMACTVASQIAEGLGHDGEQSACLEALSEVYGALNNRGPAVGTLHRAYRRYRAASDQRAEAWLQAAAVLSALEAQYLPERHADGLSWCADQATDLLDRVAAKPRRADEDLFVAVRRRFLALPDQGRRRVTADGRAADAGFAEEMSASMAESLLDVVDQSAVHVPMIRALNARRAGRDQDADFCFTAALARADELGARGRSLRILTLLAARRFDDAVIELTKLRATGEYPEDLATDMLIAAHRYDLVAATEQSAPTVGRWRTLLQPAEMLVRTGDPLGAARLLDAARTDFEAWFASVRRDPFRVSVTDDASARWLYLLSAEAAADCGRPEDSLALSDRLRALPLLCLLGEAAGGPWAQANAVWSTAFDLVAWSGMGGTVDTEVMDPALALLAERTPDELLDRAQLELESTPPAVTGTPVYAALDGSGLPLRLDVDALRRRLPADTLLLSYLFAGDRLLAWAVGSDLLEVKIQQCDTDRLTGHANRLRDACAGLWIPGDAEESRVELGRVLLEPFGDLLRHHTRVVVAPSGALHVVPFAVLPFDDTLFGGGRILSTVPAVALLTMDRPLPIGDVCVVGDVGSTGLPRLAATAVEARAVAAQYGAVPLLGSQATASAVLRRLPTARIVHLATHGLLSEVAPTASAVALHGLDRIHVSDLAGLAMDAELVVLSACDSGRGDTTIGGDVIGLARQLLAAGVRNVLVSLWPVDDVPTAVLMEEFHRRYQATNDAPAALAGAQDACRGLAPAQIAERFRVLAGPDTPVPMLPRRRGIVGRARDWAGFVLVRS